ncbi:MAG: DUF2971 domain-containing protein [Terracidiphilus sp.]|jgi:hypothetical protein
MKDTDPIHAWLNSPIPETLWHYTSIGGFQGITTSREIYATDSRFLNDREEIVHARTIAKDLIEEYPEADPEQPGRRRLANLVISDIFSPTGMFSPNSLLSYVSSFSTAADSLSQWRGYSKGSSGACLGFKMNRPRQQILEFDVNWLHETQKKGYPACFAPCVYDHSKKKELLRQALSRVLAAFKEIFSELPEVRAMFNDSKPGGRFLVEASQFLVGAKFSPSIERFRDALLQTIGDLLNIAPLLKNVAFKEENEWRLVIWSSAGAGNPQHPLRFRAGDTSLVPYIAYPLGSGEDMQIDLSDVLLGPGSDEHGLSVAQSFLKSIGLNLKVGNSSAPFRRT